ncbi:hypothetical protein QBC40DRAFT_96107 [Triangularia verruculosa]|uniref:Zn(2)-C6 fungal-type domain-containing protein n=1 Tax=Triangularia verruculosa TaxID=2587418 RepID=A0AAN6XDG7_9PEZI|nr:hypothetical protein QBC40DRAFT_96107 [Triangularia verruculosa]
MCDSIGCLCLGVDGRFGFSAPVSTRSAVGSFVDRFRWALPTRHDWPRPLHIPRGDHSGRGLPRVRPYYPEPHQDINSLNSLNFLLASHLAAHPSLDQYPSAFWAALTMDFSGKDLEDIQRVAGLLNLTVDELLEQSRARTQLPEPATLPVQQSLPLHPLQQQAAPSAWYQHVDQELESLGLDDDFAQLPQETTVSHHQGTTVELLNPRRSEYDCDAGIWDFDAIGDSFEFNNTRIDSLGDEAGSLVSATPMQLDSESISDTLREEPVIIDDASTDWALVPSPGDSQSSAMSPSSTSGEKRYPALAPKASRSSSQSVSEGSSHRVRKKRSPYEGTKKIDTHLTRQVHACVRCRMQRNRCIPDPNNPRGPCLTCQQRTVRMSRLPCLRYMVTDTILFRTGLDYMPFYRNHPMIGPNYGDFHLERQWVPGPSKYLCLGQIGSMSFTVELKQFVPPANSGDLDLKGRPMYAVPWAVADPEAVVQSINEYIDRGITRYMDAYLDEYDELVWGIFQAAYRASIFPVPNEMLRKTLKLWVACRFVESKWRCWAAAGWADGDIMVSNPQDPYYKDIDSLPPYLDYQVASIIIHRILTPLRKDVLRELQATFNVHSPNDWFISFLASFILLQNYEMQMLFQRQFAARRQAKVQYLDMPLVRATNSGAKTILAHFHYCYKGQQLFTEGFNWNAPRVRRMARLDKEQTDFMAQCRDIVVKKGPMFEAINHTDVYHNKYWYTSQLFDPDWTPRDTLEHAPPAQAEA